MPSDTTTLEALPLKHTVLAGGVELHHAEAGNGPPLVFVHGGFGDWRSWAPQWDAFVPHFRCISYSRRHSAPNCNDDRAQPQAAQAEASDLEALLVALHATPAVLVGTSYGALTALVLALQAPHKVRALALAEPPVLTLADRAPGGLAARLAFERDVLLPARHAFEQGRTQHAVRVLVEGINGSDGNSAVSPGGIARRIENERAMRMLLASPQPFPMLDDAVLRALDVPTLLLAGAHTQPIHDATFRALREAMPQARHARVPDCGHGAHRDNPLAFNNAVLEFLRGLGLVCE